MDNLNVNEELQGTANTAEAEGCRDRIHPTQSEA